MDDFINRIRSQWYNLSLIPIFKDGFSNECYFRNFRCLDTADFLWDIFVSDPKDISHELNISSDKYCIWYLNISEFSLKEYSIPGHAWLIIKNQEKYFILQSFVRAYNIASPFGFLEIKDPKGYFDMLNTLKFLMKNNKYTDDDIKKFKEISEMYAIYTQIDIKRSLEEMYGNHELKFIVKKYTINDITNFIKSSESKLCEKIKKVFTLEGFKDVDKEIRIYPAYHNIYLTKNDINDDFLNRISYLTGLKSRNYDLINVTYLDDPLCILDDKQNIIEIKLDYAINYTIKNIICQDLNKNFTCNIEYCQNVTLDVLHKPDIIKRSEIVKKENEIIRIEKLLPKIMKNGNTKEFINALKSGVDVYIAVKNIGYTDNIDILKYLLDNYSDEKWLIIDEIIDNDNFKLFKYMINRDIVSNRFEDIVKKYDWINYVIKNNYMPDNLWNKLYYITINENNIKLLDTIFEQKQLNDDDFEKLLEYCVTNDNIFMFDYIWERYPIKDTRKNIILKHLLEESSQKHKINMFKHLSKKI